MPLPERYCLYPSVHSALLLFAKTDRDHLMVVTVTFNNATDYLDPVNSMPEKVQQNMF